MREKYFRKRARQDKLMARQRDRPNWRIRGMGATMHKMSTISSLAIVLGLSILSMTSAAAGSFYDAQLADWGGGRIDASRGFLLPGIGPSSPRDTDVRGPDASVGSCRLRNAAATESSGNERDSAASARERCERRSMGR